MSLLRTSAAFLALAAFAALSGCGKDGSEEAVARSSGWNGRFRAKTERGIAVLTLEDLGGGSVRVTSSEGAATGRITAPGRVEGAETSEQGGGTFVLVLRGDRLTMKATVVLADGRSVDVPEIVFDRAAPEPAGGARDRSLVGHWRHTESHASSGFSMATDVHFVLAEDGTYASWSKSAGSAGESESERTTGVWKTEGGVLFLRPDGEDAWHEKGAYTVSDSNLLLTYGPRDKQVFERL